MFGDEVLGWTRWSRHAQSILRVEVAQATLDDDPQLVDLVVLALSTEVLRGQLVDLALARDQLLVEHEPGAVRGLVLDEVRAVRGLGDPHRVHRRARLDQRAQHTRVQRRPRDGVAPLAGTLELLLLVPEQLVAERLVARPVGASLGHPPIEVADHVARLAMQKRRARR